MTELPDPSHAPPISWGIIGAGGIARKFATDIPAHTASSVVAIGSRSADRARAFAREFDIPAAHGDYVALVEDERVQAVYVASPHSEHREHALLALRAGKPVLVEKSFARNAPEAREVFAAADAAGLFVMEAMWTRFLPHMAHLRAALQQIGQVVTLSAHHGQYLDVEPAHRLKNPDLAGGALLDLGVYPVSFAHQVLGSPESVTAVGHLAETGVDATIAITLSYPDAVASLTTTLRTATRNDAVVSGTAGRIEIAPTFYAPTSFTIHTKGAEPVTVDPPVGSGFEYQAAEAARCIAEGRRESELITWEDTIAVMRTMDEVRSQLGVVYPGEED